MPDTTPSPSSPAPADDEVTAALEKWRAIEQGADIGEWHRDAFNTMARTAFPRLLAAIEAVLKRHRPVKRGLSTVCSTCVHRVGNGVRYDRSSWPCPEVEAITRELTGKEESDA